MIVLGIETATAVCGAAATENGRILASRAVMSQQVHSERLLGLIEACRSEAGPVGAVAVSAGPGSFTGLRIGFSVAKGIAYAGSIPLIAVPTLAALAFHASGTPGIPADAVFAPMLDARRDEVYVAAYRMANGFPDELMPAAAMTVTDAAAALDAIQPGGPVILCGDGWEKFQDAAGRRHRTDAAGYIPAGEAFRYCDASAVALIGEVMLDRGAVADLASCEPMYVREFYTAARPAAMKG